jgi:hypothetical protein
MLQQSWALLTNIQCVCFQQTESVVQLNLRSIISREPAVPRFLILWFNQSF